MVLLSLSVAGNIAATFYSSSLNIQVFIPPLVAVPRHFLSLVVIAVYDVLIVSLILFAERSLPPYRVTPLSIVGAHRFYDALLNFLSLISYWSSAFGAIIVTEHLIFRRNNPASYDVQHWKVPSKLPSGIAALGAGVCSFGLVIPCMDQAWFVGPIAKTTGDIGFEMAFVLSVVLYVPFRALELKVRNAL
jgi:purine-cytosine permease-like protein